MGFEGGQMRDEQSRLCIDDIFEADIILPSQYFDAVASQRLSGEQRLMLAVLIDAINVLHSWKGTGSVHKRRNYAEAIQWINTHGTKHPFSFESVCDALGIEPGLLRSRLCMLKVRSANAEGRLTWAALRIKN
jgi:hypothetical protein